MSLLAVEKLEVVYHHAITAVQGITLAVEAGRIVALLGTNGAGKTTTLRAISGFLGVDDARVSEGTITFKGERIEIAAHDFPARVIQHETDHLDGVLFLDRMRSLASLSFLEEYGRYWSKDRD